MLCGGVCAFLNPEPLAEVIDLFAVGEAEVLLAPFVEAVRGGMELGRPALLQRLAALPGIYVPSLYAVEYHPDGTVAAYRPSGGAPPRVARQWLADLDRFTTCNFVLTPETEFGDMSLVEISRGCSRGCRITSYNVCYTKLLRARRRPGGWQGSRRWPASPEPSAAGSP